MLIAALLDSAELEKGLSRRGLTKVLRTWGPWKPSMGSVSGSWAQSSKSKSGKLKIASCLCFVSPWRTYRGTTVNQMRTKSPCPTKNLLPFLGRAHSHIVWLTTLAWFPLLTGRAGLCLAGCSYYIDLACSFWERILCLFFPQTFFNERLESLQFFF